MANALGELIADASSRLCHGPQVPRPGLPSAPAAGVCAVARKKGVRGPYRHGSRQQPAPADHGEPAAASCRSTRMCSSPPGRPCCRRTPSSLLVVVDTNRPDQVVAEQLLLSCNKVAVIDHHRRAANYIENAALNFHEPYASSACELVTELLQYLLELRRPAAGRGRGAAGRHRAGHQELHHPHRRTHL